MSDTHEKLIFFRFAANDFDSVQYTLVDCPGHGSLIKTIIGGQPSLDCTRCAANETCVAKRNSHYRCSLIYMTGAQIIDMMILVVDINKVVS